MGRKKINEERKTIAGDTPGRTFYISPKDIIQWRYEMIRETTLSKQPIEEVTEKYGYSRDMYFYYKHKFETEGILGMADSKPGPKEPTKRTAVVEKRIVEIRFKRPELNMFEIYEILRQEGYDISARSVGRTLTEHGLGLKKTKEKGRKFIS